MKARRYHGLIIAIPTFIISVSGALTVFAQSTPPLPRCLDCPSVEARARGSCYAQNSRSANLRWLQLCNQEAQAAANNCHLTCNESILTPSACAALTTLNIPPETSSTLTENLCAGDVFRPDLVGEVSCTRTAPIDITVGNKGKAAAVASFTTIEVDILTTAGTITKNATLTTEALPGKTTTDVPQTVVHTGFNCNGAPCSGTVVVNSESNVANEYTPNNTSTFTCF